LCKFKFIPFADEKHANEYDINVKHIRYIFAKPNQSKKAKPQLPKLVQDFARDIYQSELDNHDARLQRIAKKNQLVRLSDPNLDSSEEQRSFD
jgi:hypothetical protein